MVLLLVTIVSLAQVPTTPEYTTGGATFAVSRDYTTKHDYAGFDASMMPELVTGVTWTNGDGTIGPMEAFPITPDEMALRDDIMPTLSAGPAVTNTDAAHDQQGGTVYDNMFCEPMSMGEHVEEGGVFDDCKQFCLQDMDCAAATYYSVSEADDLFVSGNPWRGPPGRDHRRRNMGMETQHREESRTNRE